MLRGKGTAEELRHRVAAAVQAEYPEQEPHLAEHARQGTIPESILEVLKESQTAHDNVAEGSSGDATYQTAAAAKPKPLSPPPKAASSQTSLPARPPPQAPPPKAASSPTLLPATPSASSAADCVQQLATNSQAIGKDTCLTPQLPAPPRRSQLTVIIFLHSLSGKRLCSGCV